MSTHPAVFTRTVPHSSWVDCSAGPFCFSVIFHSSTSNVVFGSLVLPHFFYCFGPCRRIFLCCYVCLLRLVFVQLFDRTKEGLGSGGRDGEKLKNIKRQGTPTFRLPLSRVDFVPDPLFSEIPKKRYIMTDLDYQASEVEQRKNRGHEQMVKESTLRMKETICCYVLLMSNERLKLEKPITLFTKHHYVSTCFPSLFILSFCHSVILAFVPCVMHVIPGCLTYILFCYHSTSKKKRRYFRILSKQEEMLRGTWIQIKCYF